MKLSGRLFISTLLALLGGGSALAQLGSGAPAILTASVGSNLGAVSNPSGFNFGASTPPSATSPVNNSQSGVLGFQVWKQTQIDGAKQTLEKIQALSPGLAKTSPAEIAKNPKLLRLDQRMRQSQLNVEIAQELTVNDYFLIYLSQFKTKEALTEAAQRLSPEEMAELLLSYQRYVSRADQIEAPASGLLSGFGGPPPSRAALVTGTSKATTPAHAQSASKTPRPRL